MKTASAITLILGLTAAFLQAQAVPALISYQGKVVDGTGTGLGTGTPVNRKILFRLFDAGTAGTRLWSEEQTVTLSNGDFSVILGQGIAASYNGSPENPRPSLLTVFAGTDRYLEIIVDNGDGTFTGTDSPITPRQRLISTAFAIRAATADSVASGTDLSLRDANHGLGWYGTGRLFNGVNLDGPVLYGFGGGALGSVSGSSQNLALRWTNDGKIGIGTASPTEKLDLVGNAKISGSVTAGSLSLTGAITAASLNLSGAIAADSVNLTGSLSASGVKLPGAGAIDSSFIGTTGNFLGFGHAGTSEDFIGYNDNIFYFRDSPGGGDTVQPSINVGNNITAGGNVSAATVSATTVNASGDANVSGTTTTGSLISGGSISTAADIISGNYSSGDRFVNVRTQGSNSYRSGIKFQHHDGNWGWSLFSDERTTDGYGFHIDSVTDGTVNSRLFIALDGKTGIGTKAPAEMLEVSGNIKATGKVVANGKTAVVGEEDLRFIRGTVSNTGTKLRGSGFSSLRSGIRYNITFDTAFSAAPSVLATVNVDDAFTATVYNVTTTGCTVRLTLTDNKESHHDREFSFIAAGPR